LQYKFSIIHKPGKENIADYLSRYPTQNPKNNSLFKLADQYINAIIDNSPVIETISKQKLVGESSKDSIISKIIQFIQLSKGEKEIFIKINSFNFILMFRLSNNRKMFLDL
jgi:hypothetical protein